MLCFADVHSACCWWSRVGAQRLAAKDMALVSNKSNGVTEVSMPDLMKICKGQTNRWPKGRPVTFFSLQSGLARDEDGAGKSLWHVERRGQRPDRHRQSWPGKSSRHRGRGFRQGRWWKPWNPRPARSGWWTCTRLPGALRYCVSKASCRSKPDTRCTETRDAASVDDQFAKRKPTHEHDRPRRSKSTSRSSAPLSPLSARCSPLGSCFSLEARAFPSGGVRTNWERMALARP